MPPRSNSTKKPRREPPLALEDYYKAEAIDPRSDKKDRERRYANDPALLDTIVVKDDKEIKKWNARFETPNGTPDNYNDDDRDSSVADTEEPAKKASKVTKLRLVMNWERRRMILEQSSSSSNPPASTSQEPAEKESRAKHEKSESLSSIWDLPPDSELHSKRASTTTYKKRGRPRKESVVAKDFSDEEGSKSGKNYIVTDDEEEEKVAAVHTRKAVTGTRAVAVEKIAGRRRLSRKYGMKVDSEEIQIEETSDDEEENQSGEQHIITDDEEEYPVVQKEKKMVTTRAVAVAKTAGRSRSPRKRGGNEAIEEDHVEEDLDAEGDINVGGTLKVNPVPNSGKDSKIKAKPSTRRRSKRFRSESVVYHEKDSNVEHSDPDRNTEEDETIIPRSRSPIIPSSHRSIFGRQPTSSSTPSKRTAVSPPHTMTPTKRGRGSRGRYVEPRGDMKDEEPEPTTPTPRTRRRGARGAMASRGSTRGRSTTRRTTSNEPSLTDNESEAEPAARTMRGRRGRGGRPPRSFASSNRGGYSNAASQSPGHDDETSDEDESQSGSSEEDESPARIRGSSSDILRNRSTSRRIARGSSLSELGVIPESPRESIRGEVNSDSEDDGDMSDGDDDMDEAKGDDMNNDDPDDYNDEIEHEDGNDGGGRNTAHGQNGGNGGFNDNTDTIAPNNPISTPANIAKKIRDVLGLGYFSI